MSKPRRKLIHSIRVSECYSLTRTLLLDLDGTLIDTVPDLAAALNRLMHARGLAGFTLVETAAMVGDGVAKLVERACAARGQQAQAADVAIFSADYAANTVDASRPFPGVADTLRLLNAEGWRLAVCTNKPEAPARTLLRAFGLDKLICAVGGGDSFPVRKPDPRHLLATLASAGGIPTQAVMVGDHANDVAAATGAGLPCIFAAWGYGPPAMAAGAAATAAAFTEVPALAGALLATGPDPALAG